MTDDFTIRKQAHKSCEKHSNHTFHEEVYCDGFYYGYKAGYHECEKEHEWHKVLNGDLPKHDHEVLCLLWGGTKEIGYYKNDLWYFENFTADNEDVDYWQEIIPLQVETEQFLKEME